VPWLRVVRAPPDAERAEALSRALQRVEQALHPDWPHWLVSRTKWAACPCRACRVPRRLGREGRYWHGPHAGFGPVAREFKKFHFLLFELV
jgi:hypothetical protein